MRDKLKKFLNYNFNEAPKDSTIYLKAERLKSARKEKGLTLEEAAEGICSKSLLSRIEKTKVSLKDDVFIELSKRVGLKDVEIEFDSKKHRTIIMKSIKEHFKKDKLSNYYDVVFNDKNFKVILLRFAYSVTNKELNNAKNHFDKLIDSYLSFQKEELIYFSYFLSLYLFYSNKNLYAYKFLDKILPLVSNSDLKIMVKRLYIITALNLGRYNNIKDFIKEYQEYLLLHNYMKELYEILPYYRQGMLLNIENNKADYIISKVKIRTKGEKNILNAISEYRNNNYEEALEYLNNISLTESHHFLYYLVLLDLSGKGNDALDFLKDFEIDKKVGLINEIEMYITRKSKDDPKMFFNFLIKKYFIDKEIENYDFINYLFKSSFNYFIEKGYYKLACSVYSYYDDFTKELLFS